MWGPELYCIFQVWTDERFLEQQHHFSVLVLEMAGNESEYSICNFAAFFLFVAATWGLWWWWFQDLSAVQSLATVGWTCVVAIYIFRNNAYHCAFVNIKFHLSLVRQILKLVYVFLRSYCVVCFLLCGRVWFFQRIWILCWWCCYPGHWSIWGIVVVLVHYIVMHQTWLVSSHCWFGWCRPFGGAQLVYSWSIWLRHLGCHVILPLPWVSHVVPCQLLFGSQARPDQ